MTASEADAAARNAQARTALRASAAYDSARRRLSVRNGRERGCWVYIPAAELHAAGMPLDSPPPWYRTWGRHSRGSHSVVVGLYREP